MDRKDLILQDSAISRQIDLFRFTASEKKKVLAILAQLEKDLKLKLLGDLTDFSRARVNRILKEANAVIGAAYKGAVTGVGFDLPTTLELKSFLAKSTRSLLEKGYTWAEGSCGEFAFAVHKWLGGAGELINVYNSTGAALHLVTKVGDKYIDGNGIHTKSEVLSGYFKGGRLEKVSWNDYENYISKPTANALAEKLSNQFKAVGGNSTDMLGLAQHEAQATAQSFAAIGLEASLPTVAVMKAIVNGSLIEGAPSAAWWAKQSTDLQFKFAAQVRQGITANETVQQIVRRIIGSSKLGIPGIMETSRAGATALVHTSIQQVANDARLATFRENADVIKGVQQLSTLDGRTSAICVAYSGASWDLDGNPINGTTLPFNGGPPRHFNCRSVLVPITRTYKELGIDIPEAPPGTRASDEGQVPADMTMAEWLKSKPTSYVDDLLGQGRADLFLSGKLTLPQLLDLQGNPLTLDQLRAKYK